MLGKTEECERGQCGWAVSRAEKWEVGLERYTAVIGPYRSSFGFSSKYDSHWMVLNKSII